MLEVSGQQGNELCTSGGIELCTSGVNGLGTSGGNEPCTSGGNGLGNSGGNGLCTYGGNELCNSGGNELCTFGGNGLCTSGGNGLCTSGGNGLCTYEGNGLCTSGVMWVDLGDTSARGAAGSIRNQFEGKTCSPVNSLPHTSTKNQQLDTAEKRMKVQNAGIENHKEPLPSFRAAFSHFHSRCREISTDKLVRLFEFGMTHL